MRINLPVTGIERHIPEGEVLVSKTDLKGRITYCNRAFIEVSGYGPDELLGAPHNLVRHPDVPSEVFADLWATIAAGNPWNGIVKNRCKNGDHYWVEANVTPLLDAGSVVGYVSLRYRASREQAQEAERAYQAIREGLRPEQVFRPSLGYIVDLQQRLADKVVALEEYRDLQERDLRLGNHIMSRMLRMDEALGDMVRRYIRPAGGMGGDALIAARTPANMVHAMLVQAPGQGLSAAISVLPVCRTFYELTEKGFSIGQIARDLNELARQVLPEDCHIAMSLVSINPNAQSIEVWNGGVPALQLMDVEGRLLNSWPSLHPPLGVLSGKEFVHKPEVFHYKGDCQLYMFSGGAVKGCCSGDESLVNDRVIGVLSGLAPARRFEVLVETIGQHLAGCDLHEDVSLAMLDLSAGKLQVAEVSAPEKEAAGVLGNWRVSMRLGASELRYLDVVPLMVQMLSKIQAAHEHQSALFLIISELFNNALDHGVLQLDSRLKQGGEGFEQYLELRERRMQALEQGEIAVSVESAVVEGKSAVKIHVTDSGEGFDYQALRRATGEAQFGRGIALTRSLVHSLDYLGRGNEVVAYYICA